MRLKKLIYADINESKRQVWLKSALSSIPAGWRILDAGAGELKNKIYCRHLEYVSQDFCQYDGKGDGKGLQTEKWDTGKIDIISDITEIPESDGSFNVILCSEVFEHLPDPLKTLDEFRRLLKIGGKLIITAPFNSLVHFAPYHYCTGFSRYWYEYHLPERGFEIEELTPNGDWYGLLRQEIIRLCILERQRKNWAWPLAYLYGLLGIIYFKVRKKIKADDLACFGWHCIATKRR